MTFDRFYFFACFPKFFFHSLNLHPQFVYNLATTFTNAWFKPFKIFTMWAFTVLSIQRTGFPDFSSSMKSLNMFSYHSSIPVLALHCNFPMMTNLKTSKSKDKWLQINKVVPNPISHYFSFKSKNLCLSNKKYYEFGQIKFRS